MGKRLVKAPPMPSLATPLTIIVLLYITKALCSYGFQRLIQKFLRKGAQKKIYESSTLEPT